jgi:hypothetical protein
MSGSAAEWGERILSALGTGLVQGMLVASVVWLVLRGMRRSNAATRHAVQFVALGIVVALPILHFVMPGSSDAGSDGGGSEISQSEPLALADPSLDAEIPPIVEEDSMPPDLEVSEVEVCVLAGSGTSAPEEWVVDDIPVEEEGPTGVDDLSGGAGLDVPTEPPAGPEGGAGVRPSFQLRFPRPLVGVLALSWAGIALVRLGFLAAQCLALRRLKGVGVEPPASVAEVFRDLSGSVAGGRPVVLRIVPGISSPMAVGYFRPAVLVPSGLVDAEGVDWGRMLRHELAHVRRWDDLTNLFQQVAKAVLFFQPAVHWLSRRLSVDREIACDDHVLSATGSPRAYALFLTEFARRTRGPSWTAAPGAWSNPSQLTERITMLLDTRRDASPRLAPVRAGAWMATVLLVAMFGLYAAPRLAVAGTEPGTATVADDVTPPKVKDRPVAEAAPLPAPSPGGGATSATKPEPVVVEIRVPEPAPDPEPAPGAAPAPTPPVPANPPSELTPKKIRVIRSGTSGMAALPTPPAPGKPGYPLFLEGPMETTVTVLTGPEGSKPTVSAESGETMERRLRRLEKMVAEMQRSGGKSAGDVAEARGNAKANANANAEAHSGGPKPPRGSAAGEGIVREFHFEGLAQVLADVNQAVTQAARDAELAMRDAEKSMKLAARESASKDTHVELDMHPDAKPPKRDDLEAAGKSVRDANRREIEVQRRRLQKQIAELEGQLGRLEGQLDRLGDEMEKQVEVEFDLKAREQVRMEHQQALKKRRSMEIQKELLDHGADRLPDPNAPMTLPAPKEKTKDKSGDRESAPATKF